MKLLQIGSNQTKLRKTGDKWLGIRIVYLALAPHRLSGHQVCAESTASCRSVCVGAETGLAAVFSSILEARKARTRYYFEDRASFLAQLHDELREHQERAEADGLQLCCRLNTFSDLDMFGTVRQFPRIQFWDYCKAAQLKRWRILRDGGFSNYDLTFSWSENPRHQASCRQIIAEGGNVARVFGIPGPGYTGPRSALQPIPRRFEGYRTIDGDEQDIRAFDPRAKRGEPGFWVALRLKSANNAQRQLSFKTGFATEFGS